MIMHKWIRKDVSWHQICERCGATRWGNPGGWARAMKDGKSVKYCEGVSNESKNVASII